MNSILRAYWILILLTQFISCKQNNLDPDDLSEKNGTAILANKMILIREVETDDDTIYWIKYNDIFQVESFKIDEVFNVKYDLSINKIVSIESDKKIQTFDNFENHIKGELSDKNTAPIYIDHFFYNLNELEKIDSIHINKYGGDAPDNTYINIWYFNSFLKSINGYQSGRYGGYSYKSFLDTVDVSNSNLLNDFPSIIGYSSGVFYGENLYYKDQILQNFHAEGKLMKIEWCNSSFDECYSYDYSYALNNLGLIDTVKAHFLSITKEQYTGLVIDTIVNSCSYYKYEYLSI